jgi:hypothetical protein
MTPGTKYQQKYQEQVCPLCGGANKCQLSVEGDGGDCWCLSEQFPASLLSLPAATENSSRCICRPCLEKAQKLSYAG